MAGLLDQYQGMRLSDLPMNRRRSVMDGYQEPRLSNLLDPAADAIEPGASILGIDFADPTNLVGLKGGLLGAKTLMALPIYDKARPFIDDLIALGNKGQSAAKESVGFLTPDQTKVLAENGLLVKDLTARNMKHFSLKDEQALRNMGTSDAFTAIQRGAESGAVVTGIDKSTSPPMFSLLNPKVRMTADGEPYRDKATFKVLGTDTDLYSAGPELENKKAWFKKDKRNRR